jgi:hypothetical protein
MFSKLERFAQVNIIFLVLRFSGMTRVRIHNTLFFS